MTGGFGLWKGGGGIYWCKLELVGDEGIIHSYLSYIMCASTIFNNVFIYKWRTYYASRCNHFTSSNRSND